MSGLLSCRTFFGALACAILAVVAVPNHAHAVTVSIDQARVIKLPRQATTIVIGNPLIADASLQHGGVLVVTGKAYGSTNLLALDGDGHVVLDETLQVRGSTGRDVIVVYRGVRRQTYSCAPQCERRITLGDAPYYFKATLLQTIMRDSHAMRRHSSTPNSRE